MSSFERRGFSDELNIETPEQVELNYGIAGVGSRFVAVLLDHLIQSGFYIVVLLVWLLISSATGQSSPARAAGELDTGSKWVLAAFIFLNFCLFWGYFSLFEAYRQGQTPGKSVMKLRVIKDSGRQITLFEALTRNLLRVVDYLPGLYLTGVVTMLCNKRNKRLGDLAAGTLVVHERRDEQPLLYTGSGIITQTRFAYEPDVHDSSVRDPSVRDSSLDDPSVARAAGPQIFAADAVARLKPADLLVIDTFFARALDLSVEVRAAMALRIARQMTAKMGVALPEGNPERALEAMASAMRGSGRGIA